MTKTQRRRRFATFAGRAVRTALVLLVVAAALYVLRAPLFGNLLRGTIERALSDALGAPVTVGAIDGGWVTDLTLVDVRTAGPLPPGPVRRLAIDRVHVQYAFPGVLDDALGALRSASVVGLDLEVDPSAGGAVPDGDDGTAAPPWHAAIDAALPHPYPSVTVLGRVTVAVPGVPAQPWDVAASLGDDTASMEATAAGDVRLVAKSKRAPADERSLEATLTAHGTVTAFVAPARTHLVATGFLLDDLPAWVRAVAGLQAGAAHSGVLNADVVVTPAAAGPAHVKGSVRVGDFPWRTATVEVVEATGEGAGGVWRLGSLRVAAAGAEVLAKDVRIDASRDQPVVSAGRGTAEARSVHVVVALLAGDDAARVVPPSMRADVAFASFDGRTLAVERAHAAVAGTSLLARGTVTLPEGAPALGDSALALHVSARAQLADLPAILPGRDDVPRAAGELRIEGDVTGSAGDPTFRGTVSGSGLDVGGTAIATLDFEGAVGSARIDAARLRVAGDAIDVTVKGGVDVATRDLADVAFDVTLADLAKLSAMAPGAPALRGSAAAHGTATGRVPLPADLRGDGWRAALADLSAHVTAHVDDAAVDGEPIGSGTLDATLVWPRLDVVEASFATPDTALRVRGLAADLDLRTGRVDEATARVADVSRLRRWIDVPEGLAGAVSATLHAEKAPGDGWVGLTGTASLDTGALTLHGTDWGTLSVRVTDWRDRGGGVRVDARGPWGAADGAARVQVGAGASLSGTLDAASFRTGRFHAGLRAATPFSVEAGRVEVPGLDVATLGGRVQGGVAVSRDAVGAVLAFEKIDLSKLTSDVAGTASGEVTIGGPPSGPGIALSATVEGVAYAGFEHGRVTVRATQADGGIDVGTLDADFGATLTVHGSARLPWTVGRDGVTRVPGREPAFHATARTTDVPSLARVLPDAGLVCDTAEARIDAEGAAFTASAAFHSLRWTGAPHDLAVVPGATVVALTSDAGRTTATIDTEGRAALSVHGRATVEAALGADVWTDPAAAWDRLRDAPLAGSVTAQVPDLGPFRPLLEDAAEVSGTADVRADVGGTIARPTAIGRVVAERVAVRFRGDLPPVTDGSLAVSLTGRTATIESLRARLGYGDVEASGTVAAEDAGAPVVHVVLSGTNALLARTQYLRLRSDLDLRVDGPLDDLLVTGRADVSDVSWTQPMSLTAASTPAPGETFQLFSLPGAPWDTTRLDVAVRADRTIHAQNDVVTGTLSADLRLRGTLAAPEPEGRIVVMDGRVTLPFTKLDVVRGEVEFPRGRPFAPRVQAAGRARIHGYDVDVQVAGEVTGAAVTVATNPPLSQQEAMLLVSTGATPAELEREGVSRLALSRAQTLVGDRLVSWFAGPSNPSERSLLERFELEMGTEVTRSGADTVNARFALTDRFYLHGERDRYDDYDLGVLWRFDFR